MHVLQEILKHDSDIENKEAHQNRHSQTDDMVSSENTQTESQTVIKSNLDSSNSSSAPSLGPPVLDEEELKAISEATASADASYAPSQSLLSSNSPYPLIRNVDGLSLRRFNPHPSKFFAKDVIIPLRGKLNVPVHVTTSGSIVDYTIQSKDFDIGFGVSAEREDGITVVKEKARQNTHIKALSGRFLVGSVPCALIFTFDNEYSWFREKKISYNIIISPPTVENIIRGRRTRANKALNVVQEDRKSAEQRLESLNEKSASLRLDIERLTKELEERKKGLGVLVKEESWLKQRLQVREVQESLLTRRLEDGWEDESQVGIEKDEEDEDVERAEV